MAEHVKREVDEFVFRLALESLMGDLDRKRVTAENIISCKYAMYSNAMLMKEASLKGMAPKCVLLLPNEV